MSRFRSTSGSEPLWITSVLSDRLHLSLRWCFELLVSVGRLCGDVLPSLFTDCTFKARYERVQQLEVLLTLLSPLRTAAVVSSQCFLVDSFRRKKPKSLICQNISHRLDVYGSGCVACRQLCRGIWRDLSWSLREPKRAFRLLTEDSAVRKIRQRWFCWEEEGKTASDALVSSTTAKRRQIRNVGNVTSAVCTLSALWTENSSRVKVCRVETKRKQMWDKRQECVVFYR